MTQLQERYLTLIEHLSRREAFERLARELATDEATVRRAVGRADYEGRLPVKVDNAPREKLSDSALARNLAIPASVIETARRDESSIAGWIRRAVAQNDGVPYTAHKSQRTPHYRPMPEYVRAR